MTRRVGVIEALEKRLKAVVFEDERRCPEQDPTPIDHFVDALHRTGTIKRPFD